MSRIGEATLSNGKKVKYVITDNPPRGGMKYTYFAPDKSYVVQFFNEPNKIDRNMSARLEAIISYYPRIKGRCDRQRRSACKIFFRTVLLAYRSGCRSRIWHSFSRIPQKLFLRG